MNSAADNAISDSGSPRIKAGDLTQLESTTLA